MAIGPYSPCPGGTGDKVKFCCSGLLGELQKMERMLEGEQFLACLGHIEHLEKTHPDKACLLATKTLLLRMLERGDEARATVATFLEKHPNNPVALAESALVAAIDEESRRGVELILRALRASGSKLHPRVYQAMGSLSRVLTAQRQFVAARAIAILQVDIQKGDRQVLGFLMRLNASQSIPLAVKEDKILHECPEDVPWKVEFDEARSLALQARWAEAAERLAALSRTVDGEPVIWRNLATLLGWLADTPGCAEALRKLAALDVPLEEAVEAEAMAMSLSDDPLADQVDVLTLRYTVRDVPRLEAVLSSSTRVVKSTADLSQMATEDGPPPKDAFFLFDRAPAEPDAEIVAETTPLMLCQALLYGKQTDRDAELDVVDLLAPDLDEAKALLAEVAGDALDPQPRQEVSERVSATQELLTVSWRLPAHATRKDIQRITEQHLEKTMLQTWPQLPLGILGGKCPQDVAGQEDQRTRVLAAILLLESWLEPAGSRFDFNRLRSRLGLPALEPIDPQQTPLEDLPPVRWSRVIVEKLSDDRLLEAYRRAMAFSARAALENFARAIVQRPTLAGREERLMALEMMARMADDSDRALQYVEQGRSEAKQAGASCAYWDLMELPYRLERGEGQDASRLMDHLQGQHINEPGVARALAELLIEIGVLRPDGTPAARPGAAAEASPLVIPGGAPTEGLSAAEPGKLWTPESQKPTGEKPKIWTPGGH